MKAIQFAAFLLISMLGLLVPSVLLAGPGAHGPNGEHLDAPNGGQASSSAVPRFETFTESFELVGQLYANELSITLDRYASNEPVLQGKLEVEANGIKAKATFRADHGDYAITDAKLLQALAKPGKHALLFTVSVGEENDLLEAKLAVSAHDDSASGQAAAAQKFFQKRGFVIGLGVSLLLGLAVSVFFAKRRRNILNRNAA